MFKPPQDAEIYIQLVLDRSRELIESSIWQDLHVQRVTSWIENFSESIDRYFAARILDSLIYRPLPQTKALIDYLFVRALPEVTRNDALGAFCPDWVTSFLAPTAHPCVRFIPVIRDIDPPTKSGPLVARMIARHLGISECNMIWPWQIEKALSAGVKIFVFLDDFLGTGNQFTKFCKSYKIQSFLSAAQFIYAPLVAHVMGVNAVKTYDNWIVLAHAELLDAGQELFSESCDCFEDDLNSREDARKYYDILIDKIGLRSSLSERLWYGYGGLALAFSFSHASPNNSLPLLWWRAENFVPLFDR